ATGPCPRGRAAWRRGSPGSCALQRTCRRPSWARRTARRARARRTRCARSRRSALHCGQPGAHVIEAEAPPATAPHDAVALTGGAVMDDVDVPEVEPRRGEQHGDDELLVAA